MPITLAGVVISAATRGIRRVIKLDPGEDDSLLDSFHLWPGELLVKLPLASVPRDPVTTLPDLHARSVHPLVCQLTGVTVPFETGRCAVVDPVSQQVVAISHCDPGIDTHARGSLVRHDTAGIGDFHIAGTFVDPRTVTVVQGVPTVTATLTQAKGQDTLTPIVATLPGTLGTGTVLP